MTTEAIRLKLDKPRAIVLFELLSRLSDSERLEIQHSAEQRVLWELCADLEKQLVEPLNADYQAVLDAARAEVVTAANVRPTD